MFPSKERKNDNSFSHLILMSRHTSVGALPATFQPLPSPSALTQRRCCTQYSSAKHRQSGILVLVLHGLHLFASYQQRVYWPSKLIGSLCKLLCSWWLQRAVGVEKHHEVPAHQAVREPAVRQRFPNRKGNKGISLRNVVGRDWVTSRVGERTFIKPKTREKNPNNKANTKRIVQRQIWHFLANGVFVTGL